MAPAKTLYVRENDLPAWERAEKVAQQTSKSLSQIVATALRRYLGTTDEEDEDIRVITDGSIGIPPAFDEDVRPALQFEADTKEGYGWTLYYLAPGGGVEMRFIERDEGQVPLDLARDWLRRVQRGGEITVEVGHPSITVGFLGRWLVEPDADGTRTGEEGHDAGAYWGIALTKRGRFAVYVAHRSERWPARLNDYDTLDAAAKDVPPDILTQAAAELGEHRVVWRDI